MSSDVGSQVRQLWFILAGQVFEDIIVSPISIISLHEGDQLLELLVSLNFINFVFERKKFFLLVCLSD